MSKDYKWLLALQCCTKTAENIEKCVTTRKQLQTLVFLVNIACGQSFGGAMSDTAKQKSSFCTSCFVLDYLPHSTSELQFAVVNAVLYSLGETGIYLPRSQRSSL